MDAKTSAKGSDAHFIGRTSEFSRRPETGRQKYF
jgi:hypothetical protein